MTQPLVRPQDHLRIRPESAVRMQRVIPPRSTLLWTVLSLPLLGYFVWYWLALRDCARLVDDDSEPWFWMAMLFPGLILVIPYVAAQARVVARVEVASRSSLSSVGYLALCVGGVLLPALMPLVLQPRLNQASRIEPTKLRATPLR
ncbi:MAG TPA: hypothetical protein VJU80_17660 [Solirubrobacteraceae bacterium]|nr:hypothetical protein [Solirubrobacteraceae bacterium]